MEQTQLSPFLERQYLSSNILALSVLRLFPNVLLAGGGVNTLGFYYDFIFEQSLPDSMLELIEVEMHRIAKEGYAVRSVSMMRENAQVFFEHQGHLLLADEVASSPSNIVELIQVEGLQAPCPPLSLSSTEDMGHVKLFPAIRRVRELDEGEVVITRLEGRSELTARDLKQFVKKYDAFLKKNDHRALGPVLNLFSFSERAGELGVVWHPKGIQLQNILLSLLRERFAEEIGDEISTPPVALDEFLGEGADEMEPFFFDGEEYRLRSTFLRQHLDYLNFLCVKDQVVSSKITEFGSHYRYYPEPLRWGLFCRSGYLGGETTICCLKEEVKERVISSLHFIEQIITIFDFEAYWVILTSRRKSVRGRLHREVLTSLEEVFAGASCVYSLASEKEEKEDAEGPGLELRVKDVLGREWSLARIGILIPERGEEASPKVIIRLQAWESLDRLIGLLIERYEGSFPLWLAPEQVRVLAIGEANHTYAKGVCRRLKEAGVRVTFDGGDAKLGARVHQAERECVPFLLLIGEQERIKQKISVRKGEKGVQNSSTDVESFLTQIKADLIRESKTLES